MAAQKRKRALSPIARARRRQKRAWTVAGLSVAALVIVTAGLARGNSPRGDHPTPRPAAQEPQVVSAARYASYPRVAETYKMAAAVPGVLDGIYCYCHCHENMGHYSLLDCYTSDHAAECDVCLSEGTLAYQMSKQGKSLNQIRASIDNTFGA